MKWAQLVVAGGVVILCSNAAWAQGTATQIVRADAAAALGWFNAKEPAGSDDSDWYSRSALGSAFSGWYWTDHLKTEIEAGGSTRASLYSYSTGYQNNLPVYTTTRAEYATRRVAVSQHYQFFRNAFFHPFVGGGVDLIWTISELEAVTSGPYVSPSPPPPQRYVQPESTDLDVHPFALIGYKAYFNQRVFFRNDLRFSFDRGISEVAIRFGIGVDVAAGRH